MRHERLASNQVRACGRDFRKAWRGRLRPSCCPTHRRGSGVLSLSVRAVEARAFEAPSSRVGRGPSIGRGPCLPRLLAASPPLGSLASIGLARQGDSPTTGRASSTSATCRLGPLDSPTRFHRERKDRADRPHTRRLGLRSCQRGIITRSRSMSTPAGPLWDPMPDSHLWMQSAMLAPASRRPTGLSGSVRPMSPTNLGEGSWRVIFSASQIAIPATPHVM